MTAHLELDGRAIRRGRALLGGLLLASVLGVAAPAQASGEARETADTPTSPLEALAAKPDVEDFSKPMGPPDPLNRGTPRGSVFGYLAAARSGDYDRAAEFLDLRGLPPGAEARGPELARRLEVVLDETLVIDVVNLSDDNAGAPGDGLAAWQDKVGDIETPSGTVPLLLQRVPREGDGVRIWKIAHSTVDRVDALYAAYEPAWLEDWLPAFFFDLTFREVALWKWLALLAVFGAASVVAALIAGTMTRVLGMLLTRSHEGFDSRIVALVRGPVRLASTVFIFAAGHRTLGLALAVGGALRGLERGLLFLAILWLAFRLIDLAALALRIRAEGREKLGVLSALVPAARIAKILVVIFGALVFLGALGVDVTAAVAGLGIGGIAVALAAQKSLENLFGGISLFADQPVRVGDFFRYGDQVGIVEEIGLRSTRVRTLDRTVVSIPNADFSNLHLENFATRDRLRLITTIGVRYETTPDQLRFLLADLRRILIAHPRVAEDPARVRFVGFGAYSLDIEIFAYVDTPDWSEFLGIREEVYLLFMDAVKEAGTGFAFPSTTTYLGRDLGLSEEDQRRAEERVAEWRKRGELPFPNYPESFWREMENSLPWPPAGSAEASAGAKEPGDPPRG